MIAFPGAGGLHRLRLALAALLAPVLVLSLAGCSEAPGGRAADGPPPNPLLYEITSADGAVEGWIFGTIHALPSGTNWRTPTLSRIVERADLLVVEIAALDDRDALATAFAALGTTPGQPALDRRLPADLHDPLADLLERGDMDADGFTTTESWAAALMLAQIDAVGDPANGVDRALIREFPAARIRELEGARAQLAIFDALPEGEQRSLLAAVVREAGAAKARGAELRGAWLAGDEAKLEAANTTGFLTDPELREALLVARNRRWDGAIAAMLANGPRPLVAVGTAHLVGPDGLVAMLRARGYRVRRMS
jgi:uncharacterized protein YbaP (TraB family)